MNSIRIACLQSKGYDSVAAAADRCEELIREAAAQDARIICTQELFLTPYFCRTQDPDLFDLAEPIPGPSTERFQALAKELKVVLILSLFERRARGMYHNTAAILDADGSYLGCYRKMHIPQDPGFEEKFYFTPGDTGFRAWDTAYGRIGVIICWDQWYPESARLTAMAGADIVFCPTAIGWLPREKPTLGDRQLRAWMRVQEGQAVANGCYYAAVNRVGIEGETEFWGHSFVADYSGTLLAEGSSDREEILIADCDLKAQEDHRRMWPFFRDRRIDAYSGLTQRWLE
ncbi:MAG: carbon-nitrogen hydrolase [Kiritimatiellae bacterium]|jgi:N-carbamoylputrescine amidase|nr:carbon-nitrogen hydrolase [Kiritimatiellia bacterium]